jgi:hypothetical protein
LKGCPFYTLIKKEIQSIFGKIGIYVHGFESIEHLLSEFNDSDDINQVIVSCTYWGIWRSRNDEMFDNPIRIRDNKAPLLFTKSSIISRIIYYIFIHTICRWEIGPTKMKNNNSNRLTSPIMDRNIDTYYTDGSKMIINYTPINSYAVVNGHGKVVNYGLTHAMQNDSFLGELAAIAVCLIFHTNKKELYIVSDSESAIKLLTGNTPANWKGDLAASRIIRTIKNAITKNSIPKITLLHINSHKTGSIHNVLNNQSKNVK